MLERCQPIVNNLESFSTIPLIQGILSFKQYIFWLYVPMHDIAISQVLDALENLLDDATDLVRFELFLFFTVLDLLVKRDSLEELEHKVVLVTVLEDLE
jgi:hypothetical protein